MDPTMAKMFLDGLFTFAESKTGNPIVRIIEREANVVLDDLIVAYLASQPAQEMLKKG